jgi:hypothetical protein
MLFTVFINIKNMLSVCQDKSFHFLSIKIKYDLYYNVTVLLLGGKGALDEPWRLFAFCFRERHHAATIAPIEESRPNPALRR